MINGDSLSLEQLENLESLCRQFEEATSPDERNIEQLIEGTAAPYRAYFLRELLWLDLEAREKQNLNISADDYTFDDPSDQEVVNAVFEERQNELSDKPTLEWPERYEVGRRVGKGGIGEIREVVDLYSQRRLAMKTLRSAFRSNAFANDRLHREAILTGRLQHPGIPPVFDHGHLSDDSTYFTMKLIDGKNLSQMLGNGATLEKSLPEFLRIFESVAQTMAYAHDNGVVHRDLKPANIMVGPFGEVQVMDWGMARDIADASSQKLSSSVNQPVDLPVDASLTETPAQRNVDTYPDPIDSSVSDSDLTRAGDVLGTPAYMSPEQAQGQTNNIGPAADVFGLGAILLEILTGSPLHSRVSVEESIERTKAGDFQESLDRLKQSNSDSKLQSLCRKCLTFDVNERPASAAWIAKEMRQYLENAEQQRQHAELQAHAANVRSEEESRRRKTSLLLSSVIGLVFVVGLAGTIWQWNIARTNANNAELRFLEAKRTVDEYLADVAKSPDLKGTPGTQALRRRLLEKARKYYEGFAASKPDNAATQNELADAYLSLGTIAQELDPGIEPIEYFEKARELSQQLIDKGQGSKRSRIIIPKSHLYSAIVFHKVEQFEEAVRCTQNGLKSLTMLSDDSASFGRVKLDLSFQQARSQQELGKNEDVDKLVAQVEADLSGPIGESLDPTDRDLQLCQIRQVQGKAFIVKENYQAAEAAYREAFLLGRKLEWDADKMAALSTGLATAVRTAEAKIDVYLEVLPDLEEYCRQNPLLLEAHRQLANIRLNLCYIYSHAGRDKESVDLLHLMLEDLRAVLQQHPDSVPLLRAIATAYSTSYNIGSSEKRYEEIIEHLEECDRVLIRLIQLVPERRVENLERRFGLCTMTGILSRTNNRIEKAVQAYRRGLAMIDEHQPMLDGFRPEVHNNLGYLYTTQGDPQAAVAELEIAAIEYQKLAVNGEPYNPYFGYEASTQTNLAGALLEMGRTEDAVMRLNSSVKTLSDLMKNRPRRSAFFGFLIGARVFLAEAYLLQNRPAEAATELAVIELEANQNQDARRSDVTLAIQTCDALRFQVRIASEDCDTVLADAQRFLKTTTANDLGADTYVMIAEVYAIAANKVPQKKEEHLTRCAELLSLALDHPERFGRMGPKRILLRAPLKTALEAPQLAGVVKRIGAS